MDLNLLREYAMRMVGTWYKYGGKTPIDGIDCSGLVSELLKACGLIGNQDELNAQGLFDRFQNSLKTYRVEEGQLGAICFYGKGPEAVTHVVFCLDAITAVGADGGTSGTVTETQAESVGAFVKLRPINNPSYRTDVVAIMLPGYQPGANSK